MKLEIKILILLLALAASAQACGEGCIRCDSDANKCIACDFRKNYVLNAEGQCFVRHIAGCASIDADGNCYACQPGKYYEAGTNTCLATSTTIASCRIMSGPRTCSLCLQGFYLNNGKCARIAAFALISSCVAFGNANLCTECRAGFIPDINSRTCIAVNTNTCSNYRNYTCRKCDTGASLTNRNAYLIKPFEENNAAVIRSNLTALVRGTSATIINSICLATTVSNCTTFRAFNRCEVCNDGYYLTKTFACEKLIVNTVVVGCEYFSSPTTCAGCANGYYKSDSDCAESTLVDNCETYSKHGDSCERCTSTYFVKDAKCEQRKTPDNNCAVYKNDKDECDSCNAGYVADKQRIGCSKLPDNCVDGKPHATEYDSYVCTRCADGYAYTDSVCSKGTIENCEIYKVLSDECAQCKDGYEVSENTCVERTISIPNCDLYRRSAPTSCETCKSNAVHILSTTECKSRAIIPNCNMYSDDDACLTCAKGFELIEQGCMPINPSEHCVDKSTGMCNKCEAGFQMEARGCVPVPEEVEANCAIPDEKMLGAHYICLGCETGFVPLTRLEETCTATNVLKDNMIPNCAKYDKKDKYECKQCNLDFALSSDKSACLSDCLENEVKYVGKLDDNEGEISIETFAQCINNAAIDDLPKGCKVASRNLNGADNVCLQCAADHVPVEQCAFDATYFNINALSELEDGQAFSVVDCIEPNETTVFVPTTATADPNCQFYEPRGNTYYCKQCVFGKTGTIAFDKDNVSYIDCSFDVQGCDSNVRFGTAFANQSWINDLYGVSLNSGFTCHKCEEKGKIPFVHVDDKGRLRPYGTPIKDQNPADADIKDGEHTVCLEPSAEGLNVAPEKFVGFVNNCALGLIVVDIEQNVDIDNSSVRCVACKNGYKPVYDNKGYNIKSCDPIPNCDA